MRCRFRVRRVKSRRCLVTVPITLSVGQLYPYQFLTVKLMCVLPSQLSSTPHGCRLRPPPGINVCTISLPHCVVSRWIILTRRQLACRWISSLGCNVSVAKSLSLSSRPRRDGNKLHRSGCGGQHGISTPSLTGSWPDEGPTGTKSLTRLG